MNVCLHMPSRMSQSFAEASQAPETKVRLSGERERLMTSPVCPVKPVVCCPVSMSQRPLQDRKIRGTVLMYDDMQCPHNNCNNSNNWFLYSYWYQSASQCIITPVLGFRINSALRVHFLHSLESIPASRHITGAHMPTQPQYRSHPTGSPFIHLGREQQCG